MSDNKNKKILDPTFKAILERSNAKIQQDIAIMLGTNAKREHQRLIDNKIDEIQRAKLELMQMNNLSSSNVTTSANRIVLNKFEVPEFVAKRAELKRTIALMEVDLKLLQDDTDFYV